ncbi:MAG: iron-sulfur cluster-binding domain-containing protein [Variovorax sp.]
MPKLSLRSYWQQSKALIDASVIDDALIARRARFYLCGPKPMMDAVTAGLIARDVPHFDVFSEVFRSPTVPSADTGQRFQVTFARSGDAPLTWTRAQGTLLSFGEVNGRSMPSGCRVGQCESCAVRVLSGKVRHLHGTEPDDPSTCLACQAVPLEDIVLDA